MKIIAQSLVPSTPLPYLHLGYISATVLRQVPDAPGYGYLFSFSLVAVVSGLALLSSATKHVPKLRKAGWAVLLTGVMLFCIVEIYPWHRDYPNPERATHYLLQMARGSIRTAAYKRPEVNKSIQQFVENDPSVKKALKDGWGRTMRISWVSHQDFIEFSLTSAGKDGQFNTADDKKLSDAIETDQGAKKAVINLNDKNKDIGSTR